MSDIDPPECLPDGGSRQLTDDLRTRIAALLEYLRPVTPLEAADAVIRELCLHREDMNEWAVLAEGFRGHRYVTHWEADDE